MGGEGRSEIQRAGEYAQEWRLFLLILDRVDQSIYKNNMNSLNALRWHRLSFLAVLRILITFAGFPWLIPLNLVSYIKTAQHWATASSKLELLRVRWHRELLGSLLAVTSKLMYLSELILSPSPVLVHFPVWPTCSLWSTRERPVPLSCCWLAVLAFNLEGLY